MAKKLPIYMRPRRKASPPKKAVARAKRPSPVRGPLARKPPVRKVVAKKVVARRKLPVRVPAKRRWVAKPKPKAKVRVQAKRKVAKKVFSKPVRKPASRAKKPTKKVFSKPVRRAKTKPKPKPRTKQAKPKAKPRPKPKPRAKPGPKPREKEPEKPAKSFRNERGRFINPLEWERQKAIRNIRRKLDPLIRKEKRKIAKDFPIPPDLRRKLDRDTTRIARHVSDETKLNYTIEQSEVSFNRWDGMVSLYDLPDLSGDRKVDALMLRDLTEAAVLTMLDKLRMRKGLMFSVGLVPEETVLLLYGRAKLIMHTKWRRADSSDERGTAVAAVREMLGDLLRNKWSLQGLSFKFFYDRRMAVTGAIAKRRVKYRGAGRPA